MDEGRVVVVVVVGAARSRRDVDVVDLGVMEAQVAVLGIFRGA